MFTALNGQLPRLLVMLVYEIRVNIHAVGELLLAQGHAQRNDGDAILGDQLGAEVGGAVAGDQDLVAHEIFTA